MAIVAKTLFFPGPMTYIHMKGRHSRIATSSTTRHGPPFREMSTRDRRTHSILMLCVSRSKSRATAHPHNDTLVMVDLGLTTIYSSLADHIFQSAVFAIELYSEDWDFGPMTFQNITIVSPDSCLICGLRLAYTHPQTGTGSDASWCNETPENWNNATDFTITGLSSNVDDSGVTCNIDSIVLNHPVGSKVKPRTVTSTESPVPTPTSKSNAGVRAVPASFTSGGLTALLLAFCCL